MAKSVVTELHSIEVDFGLRGFCVASKGLLMDLAEDKLQRALPFELQWVENLGVLRRVRKLSPELQQHIDRNAAAAARVQAKGRRLPEVIVRVGTSRIGSAEIPVPANKDHGVDGAWESSGSENVDSRHLQTLAERISGPQSFQWMLGGIPLPDANDRTLSLSEAYELPCALQLQPVDKNGAPRTCNDIGTNGTGGTSTSVWQWAHTVLGMRAANPKARDSASALRSFVKPSPALTCVVWSATGKKNSSGTGKE